MRVSGNGRKEKRGSQPKVEMQMQINDTTGNNRNEIAECTHDVRPLAKAQKSLTTKTRNLRTVDTQKIPAGKNRLKNLVL